jgi:hypothetical protein
MIVLPVIPGTLLLCVFIFYLIGRLGSLYSGLGQLCLYLLKLALICLQHITYVLFICHPQAKARETLSTVCAPDLCQLRAKLALSAILNSNAQRCEKH